jgi:superfamily II DNA or RNA helicase
VVVAPVQGLLASGAKLDVDFLVIDELHHYCADQWRTVRDQYRDIPVVGITATPIRADKSPLGDIMDHIVVGDGACVSFAERGLL